jgi:proton-coupled amino acid transporter
MKHPKEMLGWNGVLNTSMSLVALLYMGIAFFGYLKYGENIKSSITLNLPPDEMCVSL